MAPIQHILSIIVPISIHTFITNVQSQTISCGGGACNCPIAPQYVGTPCMLDCSREDICKSSTLTCRPGDDCLIYCGGKASCSDGLIIKSNEAKNVHLICSFEDSCKSGLDMQCGFGDCKLECTIPAACSDITYIDTKLARSFHCFGRGCGTLYSQTPPAIPLPFSPSPTGNPTTSPTPAPTSNPVISPTNSPTISPTPAPTGYPTSAPSPAPSMSPIPAPTGIPTGTPSKSPTPAPTNVPTGTPSMTPTQKPTYGPTVPTTNPTKAPSKNPSESPTPAPTDIPSKSPTDQPSDAPTAAPTDVPSSTPTKQPTPNPTPAPTYWPSRNPTPEPTEVPTKSPTFRPTSSPTTGQPTVSPTPEPSIPTLYSDDAESRSNLNAEASDGSEQTNLVSTLLIVGISFFGIACCFIAGFIFWAVYGKKHKDSPYHPWKIFQPFTPKDNHNQNHKDKPTLERIGSRPSEDITGTVSKSNSSGSINDRSITMPTPFTSPMQKQKQRPKPRVNPKKSKNRNKNRNIGKSIMNLSPFGRPQQRPKSKSDKNSKNIAKQPMIGGIDKIDPKQLGSIIAMLENSVLENENTNAGQEDGESGPQLVIERDGDGDSVHTSSPSKQKKKQREMEVTADHPTLQPPMGILRYSSADSYSHSDGNDGNDGSELEMEPPKAFTLQPEIALIRYQSQDHESHVMPDIPEDDVYESNHDEDEKNIEDGHDEVTSSPPAVAISVREDATPTPDAQDPDPSPAPAAIAIAAAEPKKKKMDNLKVADGNVMKQFADNQKEIMALCKQLGINPMDKNMFEMLAKGNIGHAHEQRGYVPGPNHRRKQKQQQRQNHSKGSTFDNLDGIEIVNNNGNDFQFKI